MEEAGRRAARREWEPDSRFDEGAVFGSIVEEVLDNIGYDPDAPHATRIYDRVSAAVAPYTHAYEAEWNSADRALESRAAIVGWEEALREADAIVQRRRAQSAAARNATFAGQSITFAVEEAMNAAGFWLASQGGNVFNYERRGPSVREFIVSSRDHNPPTSLSEPVTHVTDEGRETGFRSLRQALSSLGATAGERRVAPRKRNDAEGTWRSPKSDLLYRTVRVPGGVRAEVWWAQSFRGVRDHGRTSLDRLARTRDEAVAGSRAEALARVNAFDRLFLGDVDAKRNGRRYHGLHRA